MSADVDRMKALPPNPPPGANADELLAVINVAMQHLQDSNGGGQQAWRLKLHRLSSAPSDTGRGKQTLPPTLKLEGTLEHFTDEKRTSRPNSRRRPSQEHSPHDHRGRSSTSASTARQRN